jgi:hypothetical protein
VTVSGTDWLKKLGSGVRPAGVEGTTPRGGVGGAGGAGDAVAADFARLLKQAREGQVSSGLSVSVDESVQVSLSDEQLARLSRAADRAEAEGLSSAVVMLDGMALLMDVGARRVTGVVDGRKLSAIPGIDGVVTAPGAADEAGLGQLGGAGGSAEAADFPLTRADLMKKLRGLGTPGSVHASPGRPA